MRYRLLLCCLLALICVAFGDEKRETEEETIARCLRDLKSEDVESRRRAAMLLGKYRTPEAEEAMVACLKDSDRQIRQSALVSLTEGPMLPASARMEIFRLLRDPDVHIRRIASSVLPEASGVVLRGAIQLSSNVNIRSGGGRTQAESAEALACLNEALDDQDASVRRNVLMAARYFPEALDYRKLVKFFRDPSSEVRVLSLILFSRSHGNELERAGLVAELANDPEPLVRLEVARLAGSLGQPGVEILRKLLEDGSAPVKVEAVRQLAMRLDEDIFPKLQELILDENLPADLRRQLMYSLYNYGDRSIPTYKTLLAGTNPTLAGEALAVLGANKQLNLKPEFFIEYISSEHEPIRKAAQRALQGRIRDLTAENIRMLLKTQVAEAKMLALRAVINLDRSERGAVFVDACMDEDTQVRTYALKQLPVYKPEGWDEILIATLDDQDDLVRQVAADAMTRWPTKAFQEALNGYLPNCKDQRLKVRIEKALKRRPIP